MMPNNSHLTGPEQITVMIMNVRSFDHVLSLIDAYPNIDCFLVSEINVWRQPTPRTTVKSMHEVVNVLRARGFNITIPSSGDKIRSAIISTSSVKIIATEKYAHVTAVTLATFPPITVATAYVKPSTPHSTLTLITQEVTSLLQSTMAPSVVFGGDTNATTNNVRPKGYIDVTPSAPTFFRSNCATSPSVAWISDSILLTQPPTVEPITFEDPQDRIGDGHRPIMLKVLATTFTYSMRDIMQMPSCLLDISAPPVLDNALYVPYDLHRRTSMAISYPSRRNLRALRAIAKRYPPRRTLRHLTRQLGSTWPSVIRSGARSFAPHDVTPEVLDFFRSLWISTPVLIPALIPSTPVETRIHNTAVLSSPLTAEELWTQAASLKTRLATADYFPARVGMWGRMARDGDSCARVEFVKLAQLANDAYIRDQRIHQVPVTLIPIVKRVDASGPGNIRPIGMIPIFQKLIRMTMYHRLRTQTRFFQHLHEANFTFRPRRGCDVIPILVRAILMGLPLDSASIIQADAVKAYDTLPRIILRNLMHSYGLVSPFVDLDRHEIVSRFLFPWGLSTSIPINRGIIQGDPWSCAIFTVVADCVARFLAERLTRVALYTVMVDDVVIVAENDADTHAISNILIAAWASVGLSVSKFRAIAPQRVRVAQPFVVTPHGTVMGQCFHLGVQDQIVVCPCREAIGSVRAVVTAATTVHKSQLSINEVIKLHAVSIICSRVPRCVSWKNYQDEISVFVAQAIPNGRTHLRGTAQHFYAPARCGGWGYTDIHRRAGAIYVDRFRRAALLQTSYTDSLASAHESGADRVLCMALHDLRLTLSTADHIVSGVSFPPMQGLVATDASITAQGIGLGFAWRTITGIATYTCRVQLEPMETTSYDMELLAVFLAMQAGANSIVSDNLAAVHAVNKLCATPSDSLAGVPGGPMLFSISRLRHIPLIRWVRGHSPNPSSEDEHLNTAADAASVDIHSCSPTVSFWDLVSTPRYTLRSPEYYTHSAVRYLSAVQKRDMLTRASELFAVRDVVATDDAIWAWYYRSGLFRSSPLVVHSILSLRSRCLFPIRYGRRFRCSACPNGRISPDLHHIAIECQSLTHERSYAEFQSYLMRTYGAGWWTPKCISHCKCKYKDLTTLKAARTFTCVHMFYCHAPCEFGTQSPHLFAILTAWARYMDARLRACYPRNWNPDDPTSM